MRLRSSLLIAVPLALGWFVFLSSYALWDPDEGRYAEIPREMLASGDWITPRLNGIKYFEKPPLQYWATAVAFEVFGESEWSSRLWTAGTGFLGCVLTGWLGRRVYGAEVGLSSAIVLGGSVLYALLGHINTLDMGLCFALQLALSGLVCLARWPDDRRSVRLGASLLASGVALGFLLKGLVALLVPGAVAVSYMLVSRDWRMAVRARPHWTALALGLTAGPWLIAVSGRNPGFLEFFFVHEHLARFLTKVHDRYQSPLFFVPVLLIGFLPWTPLLPAMVLRGWRACRSGDRVILLLCSWALFVFVFFSASQSKLVPYILPMLPALALLCAHLVCTQEPQRTVRALAVSASLSLLLAIVATVAWLWPALLPSLSQTLGEAAPRIGAALWLLAGLTGLAAMSMRYGHALPAMATACAGTLGFACLLAQSTEDLPKSIDARSLAESIAPALVPDSRVYCVGSYIQSIPFYLGRTCTLVAYRGELDMGLTEEPFRYVARVESFAEQWSTGHQAVAILERPQYETFRSAGLPMRILGSDGDLVAVSRR